MRVTPAPGSPCQGVPVKYPGSLRADQRAVTATMPDEQPPVHPFDGIDETARLRVGDGDRFLQEHRHPGFEAFDGGLHVQCVRVGDEHRIELLGIQHPGGRGIHRAFGIRGGHGGVGDRRQRGSGGRADEPDVLAPHEPRADHADAHRRACGNGHGRLPASWSRARVCPSVWHDGATRPDRSIQR
jgi:hypothetical protein